MKKAHTQEPAADPAGKGRQREGGKGSAGSTHPKPRPGAGTSQRSSGDRRLVMACLRGDQSAWAALIDKYQRLIYSIPIKYGGSAEDAADIFQAVCLELYAELSRLRNTDNLRPWLMTVTAH